MKIKGTRDCITFDFENGYVAKAQGEMLVGGRFVVFTNTLKKWEEPHAEDPFTDSDVQTIIDTVRAMTSSRTVQLIFE